MIDPRDATPAIHALMSEYLKRRTSQREYLAQARQQVEMYERQAATHADEIARLNRLLYRLGYEGY